MGSYDRYFNGDLINHDVTDAEIRKNLADSPVPQPGK